MKEEARKVKLKEDIDAGALDIKKDSYFRSAYVIDLPLDSVPGHAWQDILDREWRASLRLWDRKLFVVADKLRLVTSIDDIEAKIDWVKQVIERTNQGIDEYNKEIKARETQTGEDLHRRTAEEKVSVDAIRDSLRKRFGAF